MTDEEKEKIEELQILLFTDTLTQSAKRELIEIYENITKRQQAEIEKKDKIIDEMTKYIRVDDIEENDNIDLCDFLRKSYSDCKHLSSACEDCIKQYFENKAKGE